MNVLIVDDSKIVRKVLSEAVINYFQSTRDIAIRLFQAEDGVKALEVMSKETVDIMLLDWNMPNMTGEQVVNIIRSNKQWNKTRIIMATTEGSKESVLRIMKKGANGYLVKPFNQKSIFNTLDKIASRIHD